MGRKPATHCKAGHELNAENRMEHKRGNRIVTECRLCAAARKRAKRALDSPKLKRVKESIAMGEALEKMDTTSTCDLTPEPESQTDVWSAALTPDEVNSPDFAVSETHGSAPAPGLIDDQLGSAATFPSPQDFGIGGVQRIGPPVQPRLTEPQSIRPPRTQPAKCPHGFPLATMCPQCRANR